MRRKHSPAPNSRKPDLTIVIPALHEERRIGATLDELAQYLKADGFFKSRRVEVLVVAADTADRTWKIVESKQRQFKNLELLKPGAPVGKGRDVQYGMQKARGRLTVFMDADLATPLYHLQEFYQAFENNLETDIVIGTRNLLRYSHNRIRGLFSRVGNLLFQAISGIYYEDTQCGFKMFNERAKNICFSKLTVLGWDFDIELLAIAKANNLSVKPIRLNDWQNKPYSTHTDNVLQITVRMARDFANINAKRLMGKYADY